MKSLTTALDDSEEERKELPPKIEKLYKEIETFRDNLGKFICGHEALKKIIKVQRNPKDKSSHGFKGKKVVNAKEVNVSYFYGKVGHKAHKCKDLPEEGNPSKGLPSAYQHPQANKKKKNPKRFRYLRAK